MQIHFVTSKLVQQIQVILDFLFVTEDFLYLVYVRYTLPHQACYKLMQIEFQDLFLGPFLPNQDKETPWELLRHNLT